MQAYNGADVATAFSDGTQGTPVAAPTVTTEAVTGITVSDAIANGTITSINGSIATSRGAIIYDYTDSDKEAGDAGVTSIGNDGNFDVGSYTINFGGLNVNSQYNVRAFATNAYGTSYGARTDFWTLANVPGKPNLNGVLPARLT